MQENTNSPANNKRSEQTVFRKTSLDRVSSPEKLNDYIRISTPGIWLVLAAVFILIAGLLVWGFMGKLPTTVPASGIGKENMIIAYIPEEETSKIKTGMQVTIGDVNGTVTEISELPFSQDELKAIYDSDYIASQLCQSDYNTAVMISIDGSVQDDKIYHVSIVTDSVRPIDFLFD